MKKLSIFLVVFVAFIVFSCGEVTDDKRVKMLINETAYYVGQSDEAYQAAMASIQSHNAGKPLYLIAEEVQEHVSILGTTTMMLADIAVNSSEDIELEGAKKSLKAGVTGLYNVYKVKHNFLTEAVQAIEVGSAVAMTNVSNKYSDELGKGDGILLLAMAELASAKIAVGLPNDLSEFE